MRYQTFVFWGQKWPIRNRYMQSTKDGESGQVPDLSKKRSIFELRKNRMSFLEFPGKRSDCSNGA
jgi:hypothetical protein